MQMYLLGYFPNKLILKCYFCWILELEFSVLADNGFHALCARRFAQSREHLFSPAFTFLERSAGFVDVSLIEHFCSMRSKSNACRRLWLSYYRETAIKLLDMESCTWSSEVVRMYLQSRPIDVVYQPLYVPVFLCTQPWAPLCATYTNFQI